MSSYSVISKKNRLRLGVAVVVIIHIGFFYGFWHVKAGRVTNEVVELDIYAAKATEGLAFYEALASEECVKVLNEQVPKLGMPVYVEPPAEVKVGAEIKVDGAVPTSNEADVKAATDAKAVADAAAKTEPKDVKLEPSLFYASSPKCKGVAAIPRGAEKLGTDGFVGLELNIDKAGTVKYGEISRSSGFADVDEAALKQVKENLTFKPCQKGDTIVGCKQIVKFRWKTN
jgi:TonB family protein